MEQYRFDPYTGQPLNPPRPVNNRTWLGSGYQPGVSAQAPTQYQQGQGGQPNQPGLIVRPVASFDEAKAVPTDFSGALTIMPDWGHGYIYAKALGDNGTPVLGIYRDINAAKNSTPLPASEPIPAVEYAMKDDLYDIWEEINAIRDELTAAKAPAKEAEKPAGKGSKA